ncbi:MAG: FitA-like ribbon-helix-helix domain-containing protein [Oceanicaulis sp.]
MSAITIRNIPDHVHDALRRRAKEEGKSVEALAREALEKLAGAGDSSVESLFATLDRKRRELGVEAVGSDWQEEFDDPAFSRKVLGLDEDDTYGPGHKN